MKFKLCPYQFWGNLLVLVPGCIFIIVFAAYWFLKYPSAYYFWPSLILIVIFSCGLYTILIHTKDYFSFITITENGVNVTLFGYSWFRADWSEIKYIGEFNKWNQKDLRYFIYFSLVPVTVDKRIFKYGTPSSASMNYMTVFININTDIFMNVKQKYHAEILKYVEEDRIVQHGRYDGGFWDT